MLGDFKVFKLLTANLLNTGGGNSIVFHLRFLTHSACQYAWRHIVTGKNLGSLVQISKVNDSY